MKNVIRQVLKEELVLTRHNIFEESYIIGVLGIKIPLNESYPYSEHLRREVLEEQLLFEGFWDGAKELSGKVREFFLALKKMFSDPKSITSWVDSVKSSLVDKPLKMIQEFLGSLKEKLESWGLTTLLKTVTVMYNSVDKVAKKVYSYDGWKGALTMTGLALAISWLWDKIGKLISDGIGKVASFKDGGEDFKKWFSDTVIGQIFDVLKDKLGGFLSSIGASLTGIGGFIIWAKKAFNGLNFILETLGGVIQGYLHSFNLQKDRKWSQG